MTKKKKSNKNIYLYIGIAIVIIVLIFLFRGKLMPEDSKVDTSKTETETEVSEQIEPELEVIEPAKEVEIVKEYDNEQKVLEGSSKDMIQNLGCDIENLRLTFKLYNPSDSKKLLTRPGAFDDLNEYLKLSVNGKRVDSPSHCNKDSLESGESVECELQFESMEEVHNYGIKTGDSYEGFTGETRKNRISAKLLRLTDEKFFVCE